MTLTNFAGITECTLSLDPSGVTVVEGPNEVGKSSLVQAIDLVFRYPDSSGAAAVQAVKPVHRDVGAEVEIELTTGPYHLVYHKRWHRSPETRLTLVAPRHEQLTGRQAHERVEAILDETMDRALWEALRVQQGESITQAALSRTRALGAALDQAAAGALGGEGEEDLFLRVQHEYDGYFTPTGRPRSDWQQAHDRLAAARSQVEGLRQALEALEQDACRATDLEAERLRLDRERETLAPRIQDLQRQWLQVQARRHDVELLGSQLTAAQACADTAEHDLRARRELAENARVRADQLREREAAATGEQEAHRAAEATRRTVAQTLQAARVRQGTMQARSHQAQADLEYHLQRQQLEHLRSRHAGILSAQTDLMAADAVLQACRVTDASLTELEAIHEETLKLSGTLRGSAPTVQLEALGATDVEIGGAMQQLSPGQQAQWVVTDALEVVVPGRLRIRVSAPVDVKELALGAQSARDRERELCRALGVGDIQAARATLEARRDAQRRHDAARTALGPLLEGLTLQALEQRMQRLTDHLEAYPRHRAPHEPLPSTLELATAARDRAAEEEAQADRTLGQQQAALEAAATAHAGATEALARTEEQIRGAADDLARAMAALDVARSRQPDDELEHALEGLRGQAQELRRRHDEAKQFLDRSNPEQARELLENAQAGALRLEGEIRDLDDELVRVRERLRIQGETGLYDQLGEASSALERVGGEHDRLARRAEAAHLLYRTLRRHRDEARRRYAYPFKERVQRLGRMVYGPDFAVDLDDDLNIVRRQLAGRAVPYAALSTGAREQLCLLSRLACAAMIDGDAGVPVILDDALGNTDPERLERMGAVLSHAGEHDQIIILTCMPDRYQKVGRARVVRLDPTPPAPLPGETQSVVLLYASDQADVAATLEPPGGAIVHALRDAGRPLGKGELVGLSGIALDQWPSVIRSLLANGRVIQAGRARGARYHLP